jgi:hypothetical protein
VPVHYSPSITLTPKDHRHTQRDCYGILTTSDPTHVPLELYDIAEISRPTSRYLVEVSVHLLEVERATFLEAGHGLAASCFDTHASTTWRSIRVRQRCVIRHGPLRQYRLRVTLGVRAQRLAVRLDYGIQLIFGQ